jgi:hypothetical protein
MPSHYRGIDDESDIWRIDVESEDRPSKRQRCTAVTEIFEKYGIDCDDTDIGNSSMNERKAASFSCSSEEEDIMDASSSLESSSDTMTVEDHCDDKDHESVESILQYYIRSNNEIEFLKEGLDKLLELIGANNNNKSNNNAVSKQRHRLEMLDFGGHWMITNLLATLTRREDGHEHEHGHGHGHGHDHTSKMDAMDDEDVVISVNNNTVVEDDDERVVAVVARSCQILRELLSMKIQEAIPSTTTIATNVRYQIYCAGGIDAVVSALKRFPTSFDIQLAGCQCLSHLVSCKGSNSGSSNDKGSTGTNGSSRSSSSSSNPTTTLVNNLYQSTDRLNVIVRLLGCGMRNTLQDNSSPSSSNKLFLSNTQSWQLYFVVADIVRSVVRQSSDDSTCRSEMIRTVEKYFISDGGGRNRHSNDGDTMAIDGCNGDGMYGIGRHMYEHLMTILIDEEDLFDAGAAAISMNE